jgi:hypothetical protein
VKTPVLPVIVTIVPSIQSLVAFQVPSRERLTTTLEEEPPPPPSLDEEPPPTTEELEPPDKGGSSGPSSDEQENVNAMASAMPAANKKPLVLFINNLLG